MNQIQAASYAVLRSAFEYSTSPMAIIDTDGRYAEINSSFCSALGYTKEELICRSFLDDTYPDDLGDDLELLRKLNAGELSHTVKMKRYKHKSGRVIWAFERISAVPNEENNFSHFIIQLERVSQEQEDSDINRMLHKALNNYFEIVPDILCVAGFDGFLKKVNPAFCDLLGYPRRQLKSTPVFEFIAPEDKEQIQQQLEQLRIGIPSLCIESRFVASTGEIKWVSWNAIALPGDKIILMIGRDITEKKYLEKVVRNEQQRFSEMFFEAPVSMCILKGSEHTFSQANELYLQLAGRRNIIGKGVREVFPEAEGQGIFEIMDKVYSTGAVYTTNERLVQLDTDGSGNLKNLYLNFMFQPYRNEDGKVDGIFFFGVDITEQVAMRHEVEKSEARYRQIVETAEEGIWLLNEFDETVFVNKKMSDILQYPAGEIMGKDYSWFSDESTKSIAVAALQNHRRSGKNSFELKFVSKSGSMIWASLVTNSIVDEKGEYNGCLAMVTDVTEKKQVADELFKLSLIARNTVNSVYITNSEHQIEWANESFSRITGYSREEVVGRIPDEFLFGELSDLKTLQEIRKSRTNHAPFECEIIKYDKDGNHFWVKEQGQPLFDNDGKLSHYFVMETDITERKNAFRKLQETENEIRMFAAQLNDILETERKRIAREIHDEVGQQLTGLKMLLSSLVNMEGLQGSARKVALDMRQNLDAARAAIRALATELRPGILDTLGLIPSLEWLAESFEKKSGIKCSFYTHVGNQKFEEKVSITFFRTCQEALTNIVKHANATAVTIQMIERSKYLSLKVSDNGKGMDDGKLSDPFSMGLMGMRERAKLINASLYVESNRGGGTSLYLIYKTA